LVSVRVPTCPLERAKLAMSDTIFHDRYMREVHAVEVLVHHQWYATRITLTNVLS
jgi:hypothetical protein